MNTLEPVEFPDRGERGCATPVKDDPAYHPEEVPAPIEIPVPVEVPVTR